MFNIVGIAPHPPIIIPEVGGSSLQQAAATVEGLQELCRQIFAAKPKRLIIISPHGQGFSNAVAVPAGRRLRGDFKDFGAPQVAVEFEQDQSLIYRLQGEAEKEGITLAPVKGSGSLDHGATVPLYYLQEAGLEISGLHLTPGFLPYPDLYSFGKALRRAIEGHGLPAALLVSGDFSHRLTPDAPAGYSPRGAEFDQRLIELLQAGQGADILQLDKELIEEAGECGLRPLIVALGALDGTTFAAEIISYQGPFGVGYLVASISPTPGYSPTLKERGEEPGDNPVLSPVELAKESLRYYLQERRAMKPPEKLPWELQQRGGAFVSLKMGGDLRGCIGTIEPMGKNLAEEIITNAISAGLRDPRFPPVSVEELDSISFSVDILSPLERINSVDDLDPKLYGVLVRSGHRSGLLLPDLEGIDSAEEQVEIARRKGGIATGEPVELYRFTVKRHY